MTKVDSTRAYELATEYAIQNELLLYAEAGTRGGVYTFVLIPPDEEREIYVEVAPDGVVRLRE